MPPHSRKAGLAPGLERAATKSGSQLSSPSRRSSQDLIATIDKSLSCQLRVSLSTWRGQTKIEIADFTSVIPGTYFQSGAGVTLDIEKLPHLLKAIVAAERTALERGLLGRGNRP